MDPELIAKAHAAIAKGADPAAVGHRFQQMTGQSLPPAPVAQPFADDVETAAQKRLSARGGSALSDFLRMAAQGATFGFADEIVGAVGGKEAGERSRQRVKDLRTLAPGASLLSEIAGGVALPAFGAAGTARGVAGATGSRALGAMAGGALAGGVSGGLYGAGEAEGGPLERVAAMPVPAAVGAGGGLLFGAGASALGRMGEKTVNAVADTEAGGRAAGLLGDAVSKATGKAPAPAAAGIPAKNAAGVSAQAALRRALREANVPEDAVKARLGLLGPDAVVADLGPNLGREARAAANQSSALSATGGPIRALERRAGARGERIAEELRKSSGLPSSYEQSLEAAKAGVAEVRRAHFGPLEERFPVVSGPNVQKALADKEIRAVANRVVPGLKKRPPSFRELQDIMMELRDDMTAARAAGRPNASQKAGDRFETLIEAMRQDIPGFDAAQAAYRAAAKTVDAHEMGRAAAHKAPDDILAEIKALPEQARDAYRAGLLDDYERALRERTTGGGAATGLINAGKTMRDRLRVIAQSDEGMAKLLDGLEREATYSRTWNALAGNSTTAQQVGDMMAQFVVPDIPTDKQAIFRKLLAALGGLSPAERREAAQMVGQALMGQGEEAAKLLAMNIARGTSGAIGGAAGSAGAVAGPASLFK